ncbi:MAG: DoxX family membrane protein [Chitinophagaceae bacterium]|nr:DoxX family membrane protein [Chitinophagaceae bacterium]
MRSLLLVIRWVVGVLFIFSGLIKINDPIGLSYKMQEFFEVWGMLFLNDLSLPLSVAMNVFEVLAGVAVIIGWQMKLFSRLLLVLIVFFTFLTGYALFSGKIKTCGCFGDCIPLTAAQSFGKDIILLILIIILVLWHKQATVTTNHKRVILILGSTVIFSFVAQLYTLRYLPLIDCLPYKVGNNIKQQMQLPQGAIADSFSLQFVYKKDGKEISFDQDHFPVDFNDSLYTFISRKDVLVKKGNGLKPAIHDFTLYNAAGEDATADILDYPDNYILIFVQDANNVDNWKPFADKLINAEKTANGKIIFICAEAEKLRTQLPDKIIMGCDATVIKTAARVKPTVYYMKGDQVVRKVSLFSL